MVKHDELTANYTWNFKTKEELREAINEYSNGKYVDISKWNVSKVTNMEYMFHCSKFNGDISKWDVSKVTNMDSMFSCSEFNGYISKWNVSNVKNMNYMFYNSNFKGDISKWDFSNVTDMKCMFKGIFWRFWRYLWY